MKSFILQLLIATLTLPALSQNENRTIAVAPFVSEQSENNSTARKLHSLLIQTLRKRSDIDIIDRSMDSLVIKELYKQSSSLSIAAKGLAEQGKLSGAKEMIAVLLNQVSIEAKTPAPNTSGNQPIRTYYTAIVDFTIQIVDVTTGTVKSQVTSFNNKVKFETPNISSLNLGKALSKIKNLFEQSGSISTGDSREEAINAALQACQKNIEKWLKKSYPHQIDFVQTESFKDGIPEIILLAGLDEFVKKGTKILAFEVKYIQGEDGKKRKQEVLFAKFKVLENQGEVTKCKVLSGAKEFSICISEKKQILFVLN